MYTTARTFQNIPDNAHLELSPRLYLMSFCYFEQIEKIWKTKTPKSLAYGVFTFQLSPTSSEDACIGGVMVPRIKCATTTTSFLHDHLHHHLLNHHCQNWSFPSNCFPQSGITRTKRINKGIEEATLRAPPTPRKKNQHFVSVCWPKDGWGNRLKTCLVGCLTSSIAK